MMLQELYRGLQPEGAVAPTDFQFAPAASPWYTRLLMGVMGWVGGLLVLGFLGVFIAGFVNNAPGLTVVAVAMFTGSFLVYRAAPDNDFATQFALAASVCAQACAVLAFSKSIGAGADFRGVAWFAAAMQVALILAMPNILHRLLSTLFAAGALFVATHDTAFIPALDVLFAALLVGLALTESGLVARRAQGLSEPVFAGVAIAIVLRGAADLHFWGSMPWQRFSLYSALVFSTALLAWLLARTANMPAANRGAAAVAIIAFGALAWRAPGLISCALVLLVCFERGRRVLTTLALLGILAYLSTYYYQMNFTLLAKAGVLALTGTALLVTWALHQKFFCKEAS